MWGAIIRAVVGFAVAMLLSSLLKIVLEPHVLPILKNELGKDTLLVNSLSGVITWLPIIVFFTIAIGLLARSITESQAPG